jgi:hypothetical protein
MALHKSAIRSQYTIGKVCLLAAFQRHRRSRGCTCLFNGLVHSGAPLNLGRRASDLLFIMHNSPSVRQSVSQHRVPACWLCSYRNWSLPDFKYRFEIVLLSVHERTAAWSYKESSTVQRSTYYFPRAIDRHAWRDVVRTASVQLAQLGKVVSYWR